MSLPTFCDACKARVEWHPTHNGRSMPIDPEPHAQRRFYFGAGLKLHVGVAGIRPRMYRCHWDTCAKGNEASKRGLRATGNHDDECAKWDCEREDRHLHCFRCGDVDHLSPEGKEGWVDICVDCRVSGEGEAWRGWYGSASRGRSRIGMSRQGWLGPVRWDKAGTVRSGKSGFVSEWRGKVRQGWRGLVRSGTKWLGEAR